MFFPLDRQIAEALRRPDDAVIHDQAADAWSDLAHRLKSDAKAELQDAPAEPDLDQIMARRAEALRPAA
jgi:hypothetical protein